MGASNEEVTDSQDVIKAIKINYTIDCEGKDRRPYLNVYIFGRPFKALLDSGASNTIIGEDGMWIVNQFPAKLKEYGAKYVETADQRKHKILGRIVVPVTLEGRTREISVLVVPSLKQSLILGIDFWERMQIVTNLYNKTWEFAPTLMSIEVKEGIRPHEHLSEEEAKQLQDLIDRYLGDDKPDKI